MYKVQEKKLQQLLQQKLQKLQKPTVVWLISRHGIQGKIVMNIDPEVILS